MKFRKYIGILMAVIITVAECSFAFAAVNAAREPADEGKSLAELNGYSEEYWTKLNDNNLEYAEIPDLIKNFNPSLSLAWNQYADAVKDAKDSLDLMTDASKQAKKLYDDTKAAMSGSPMSEAAKQEILAPLKTNSDMAKKTLRSLDNTYKNMYKDNSSNAQIRTAQSKLINAAKSLMIGYCGVASTARMLEQMVELNKKSYESYRAMAEVGMATANDIMNAQTQLLSAQSNLAQIKVKESQLYNQLITMCGWPAGSIVNIGSIPEPDAARVAALNPAEDLIRAEGYDETVKNQRLASHQHTTTAKNIHREMTEAVESNFEADFNELYSQVIAAKQGYEASKAGFASAQASKKLADSQYSLGMQGEIEHIGAEISYISKKAEFEAAAGNFEQAVLNYENAVNGNSGNINR